MYSRVDVAEYALVHDQRREGTESQSSEQLVFIVGDRRDDERFHLGRRCSAHEQERRRAKSPSSVLKGVKSTRCFEVRRSAESARWCTAWFRTLDSLGKSRSSESTLHD